MLPLSRDQMSHEEARKATPLLPPGSGTPDGSRYRDGLGRLYGEQRLKSISTSAFGLFPGLLLGRRERAKLADSGQREVLWKVVPWSLTALQEKLVKISVKVVRHGRYITFQMAEVAIPRNLFVEILRLIDGLRPAPLSPCRRPIR